MFFISYIILIFIYFTCLSRRPRIKSWHRKLAPFSLLDLGVVQPLSHRPRSKRLRRKLLTFLTPRFGRTSILSRPVDSKSRRRKLAPFLAPRLEGTARERTAVRRLFDGCFPHLVAGHGPDVALGCHSSGRTVPGAAPLLGFLLRKSLFLGFW